MRTIDTMVSITKAVVLTVAIIAMLSISVAGTNNLASAVIIHHGGGGGFHNHGGFHGGFHHGFGGHGFGGWGHGWGHGWGGGVCNSFAPWWVKQNAGCFFNGFGF